MNRVMLSRLVCGHEGSRVMVHPVEGGYRAHCLQCGELGPVRESRERARRTISATDRTVRWRHHSRHSG